jgi:tetratricopeptide (TPR) repeat protein
MVQRKILEWQVTAKALVAKGCFDDATRIMASHVARIRAWEDWEILLELIQDIPDHNRVLSPNIAVLYAEALVRNGRDDLSLEFTDRVTERYSGNAQAEILLVRSAALLAKKRFSETLSTLETAFPFLSGESKGRAFGRMGLTLFETGGSWEDAFLQATQYLTGRSLGLMYLNLGYCFFAKFRDEEARAVWTEALNLVKNDPYSQAWLRCNLGMSWLRDLENH